MSDVGKDIARTVNDAESSEFGMKFQMIEILVLAIALGWSRGSWWLFGGVLIGLIIMANIRPLAIFLGAGLSLGEGIFVYYLFSHLFSFSSGIVCGILAFLISAGIHMYAYQYNHG